METFKVIQLCLLFVLGLILGGCGEEDGGTAQEEERTVRFVEGTDLAPLVAAEGGDLNVTFEATSSWTAEVDTVTRRDNWASVSPAEGGKGIHTVVVSVQANVGEYERKATLTVSCGNVQQTLDITQEALEESEPTIVVSQKEYTVSSSGDTIQVELKSNTSYEVVLPSECPWIKEVSSTRSLSGYTHRFAVAPNDTYESRTTEVSFVDRANGLEEKITVTQLQNNAIVVSQKEYTVSPGGRLFRWS